MASTRLEPAAKCQPPTDDQPSALNTRTMQSKGEVESEMVI